MVGSNGTMIAIRLVRSKLRKREERANAVHPEQATMVQSASSTMVASTVTPGGGGVVVENCCNQRVIDIGKNAADEAQPVYNGNAADKFVWQFPPPYPPPHAQPAQYTLYNDQNNLVRGLPSDRSGFAKGFRKNFGGRWRRLVKRKPEAETRAIPPELKDQLKTIYVY